MFGKTNIKSRRAVRVHWRRVEDLSIGKDEFRWRRYIAGTDIEVPIPKQKDPRKEIREGKYHLLYDLGVFRELHNKGLNIREGVG